MGRDAECCISIALVRILPATPGMGRRQARAHAWLCRNGVGAAVGFRYTERWMTRGAAGGDARPESAGATARAVAASIGLHA